MYAPPDIVTWLLQHLIEILAFITGLLYVVYTINEDILLWLFGIISSALFIWVFYHSGIYAYSILYLYYVVIGFYGWFNWGRVVENTGHKKQISIRRTPGPYLAVCILITALVAVILYFILQRYTDSDMPLLDAVLTAGGMVATWMLTQKFLEQWIFWFIVDFISCATMIYKGLYPSALLFLVYCLLAVIGYIKWKKEIMSV